MARARKSQTLVSMNSKISAVNLKTVPFHGDLVFEEGMPFTLDAQGVAAKPVGDGAAAAGAEIVFVNYVDSTRNDVIDTQGDPFSKHGYDPHSIAESGKLTGIVGNGIEIGLPASRWAAGAFPSIGEAVFTDSATGYFDAEAPAAGRYYCGIVTAIRDDRAFFMFTSRSTTAA